MHQTFELSNNWASFIPSVLFILLSIPFGYILRKILFIRLSKWAKKTKSQLDDVIIAGIRGYFIIWCILPGIYLAIRVSGLSPELIDVLIKIVLILVVISITAALVNIVNGLIKAYSSKVKTALPLTSLTQNIARIVVLVVGLLIILNSLGISITPILATLGVGGLAVALAIQDSLSNIFAGVHIILARQIKIGDYIKLESGEEGYVIDINWRTTKIKVLANNTVLIPNVKLNQTIITNFYLPDKERHQL